MNGKVIEIRDLGEFLVVKCLKGGFRLVNLETCELSPWLFEDENKITTTLNVVGIRHFRGER